MNYAGCGDLFEGLSVWQEEKYRKLQGMYPVIALSFAKVKEISFSNARKKSVKSSQNSITAMTFCEVVED